MSQLRLRISIWSHVLLTCWILLSLVGCVGTIASQPLHSNSPSSECIAQPVKLSFPVHVTPLPDASTLPVYIPSSWEPQLSDEQMEQVGNSNFISIVVPSSDNIWVTNDKGLWNFQPSTHTLKSYTVNIKGAGDFAPNMIVGTEGRQLWAFGVAHYVTDPFYSGFFSRFDPLTNRFVHVPELDKFVTNLNVSSISVDDNGDLWFINAGKLIHFDSKKIHAEIIELDDQSFFSALTVGSDGSIWLSVKDNVASLSRILRYDPSTGNIKSYQVPFSDIETGTELYFDRVGRLWVGDFGYMTLSPVGKETWNQIIRSSTFIIEGRVPFERYQWSRPFKVYQTSNGLYWFLAAAGVVTLDFDTGSWCRVSNQVGPISEDDSGNLWIAIYGQVYKYHL